jgi:3-deoxy-7-phosphoheptulonate synthase
MILHLDNSIPKLILSDYAKTTNAFINKKDSCIQLINSSAYKIEPENIAKYVIDKFIFKDDIQLASIDYKQHKSISIKEITIGRKSHDFPIIMGPCAVESENQIKVIADFLTANNLNCIRAGAFKPRTSPYSFQGLESKGLKILKNISAKKNLITFSEAKDATQIQELILNADVIQVGTKSMYDQGVLKALSKTNKPVLLKRGFSSTLQEFVQAAEFILSGGNENVILCERGIRTFEDKTRFTLDLCGVAWLKEHTNLPIVIDPSHALGSRYGIIDLSKAAVAMGIDGLLIEIHPKPSEALSDAQQQLDLSHAKKLIDAVIPFLELEKRKLV